MNTTAKWIAGILSVFCGLSPCLGQAGVPAAGTATLVAANVLGQAGASPEAAARTKVLSLLGEARAAMKAGDYSKADALVSQSEKMNVRFGLFHRGDTPSKVRGDLDKAMGKSNVALPSARFQSPGGQPVADPFLDGKPGANASNTTPLQLNAGQRLPSTEAPRGSGFGSLAMKSPAAGATHVTPADRAASDQSLVAARLSLSVGDTRTARSHLAKAQEKSLQYGPYEDSPAKVEDAIKKFEDLSGRRQQGQNTEAWRRQYAHLLIEQADSLVRWGKLDEAERLAGDAGRLGISFGQFERNPQTVLSKISEARQGGAAKPQNNQIAMGPAPGLAQPGIAGPQGAASQPSPVAASGNSSPRKAQAMALVAQARKAIAAGDLAGAEQLAQQAQDLKVPDSEFAPGEDRPWLVALAVQNVHNQNKQPAATTPPTGGVVQAGGTATDRYADTAVYNPSQDGTQNTPAGVNVPAMPATPNVRYAQAETPVSDAQLDAAPSGDVSQGVNLFRQGENALRNQDKQAALEAFRQAHAFQDQLDPGTQQRLQDHLQMLSAPQRLATEGSGTTPLIDSAAGRQQLLARQVSAEVARFQSESRRVREKDPQAALKLLQEAQAKVEQSGLDPTSQAQLLRRVGLSVAEVEKYISQNRAQIELDARNKEVREDVERSRLAKLEMQQQIADLVEKFNELIDEHRYEEAEVVARRARELAPKEPVVQQLWRWARHNRREINHAQFMDEKENAVFTAFQSVEESGIPFDDSNPFRYGDAKEWAALTNSRAKFGKEGRTRMTERELEIERKLKTPVSVQFHERPLAEVVDQLARLTGVNVHLDPRGLAEEGVTSATPVTLSLTNDISLRSALNLILEPLHLSYVIKDEVLKITSEQLRDGEVYTVTYNVADLVIPIPNFTPGNQLGLTGMLNEAYAGVGYGSTPGALAAVAGPNGAGGTGMINPQVMAQMNNALGGGSGFSAPGQPTMGGPGGLGGGAQADFDALIELITATIQPNTWDEVGGPGSVKEFATNLSLVVSQTQDVHEEIVDLLEQLRRLQDLQVTIEVRFITLTDGFFEQIGVDFDFNIEDHDRRGNSGNIPADNVSPSTTVGLQLGPPVGGFNLPTLNANLDLPFRQDSINQAPAPSVPGVNVADFAQFGFAILSDIEAYFLIRAAQADSRSNILEAPKVTLFNGQQAFVSDTVQRPFVISVIPVVGDFAAAQQPVIVVLSEGTFLSLQAVVSPDRRYVRLTIVPFFSQIGDVEEFTFEGSSTTTGSMSETGLDDNDNPTSTSSAGSQTNSGTTVQLPTFIFTTVTTTVSVPDGGTVLLGGIKRLTESRNEAGIPLLSKVPYVNRLFKNVGITRFTQSLLMMVTPRIIIQEEEEEKLGIESF